MSLCSGSTDYSSRILLMQILIDLSLLNCSVLVDHQRRTLYLTMPQYPGANS